MMSMNNIRELRPPTTNGHFPTDQHIEQTVKLAIRFDPFHATWITFKESVSKVFSNVLNRPLTSIEVSEILYESEHFLTQMKIAHQYCLNHPNHSFYSIFTISDKPTNEQKYCWFCAKAESVSLNARNYEVAVLIHVDQSEDYYGREYAKYVSSKFNKEHSMLLHRLSKRELCVFKLFAKGMTVKEIAAELYLSTYTIESHKQSIYKKLDIRGMVDLGIMAERLGLG